jgi:hypothetical protein
MKYRVDVFKQEGTAKGEYMWGWSIFDEYGDEVASQQKMFEDEQECRKEARWALSDWRNFDV